MSEEAMSEDRARKILEGSIGENNALRHIGGEYAYWQPGDLKICLDGDFTADEIAAAAWWMKQFRPGGPAGKQERGAG